MRTTFRISTVIPVSYRRCSRCHELGDTLCLLTRHVLLCFFTYADPHFRNFHGVAFDFQNGCDVVLVKSAAMEIHARLFQRGFYSSVEQVGFRVGSTTVNVDTAGVRFVSGSGGTLGNFEGGYAVEQDGGSNVWIRFPGSDPTPLAGIVGPPFYRPSGNQLGMLIRLGGGQGGDFVDAPAAKVPGGPGSRGLQPAPPREGGSNLSFTLRARGLVGSLGLAGAWDDEDNNGYLDRDGNPVPIPDLYPPYLAVGDANDFGNGWRVLPGVDPIILDGTGDLSMWSSAFCVEMPTSIQTRHLLEVPDVDCDKCDAVGSLVGTLNCLYDAVAVGCFSLIVQSTNYDAGVFYGPNVPADADFKCEDIVELLDDKSKSGKGGGRGRGKGGKNGKNGRTLRMKNGKNGGGKNGGKGKGKGKSSKSVSDCEEMGGECVVYCDTTSTTFDCLAGLCDIDIDYDEAVPVLALDQYYTGCSCKIPVP